MFMYVQTNYLSAGESSFVCVSVFNSVPMSILPISLFPEA